MKHFYRPEIDGLRAIAVLSVILYHAGIEIFKGGFVGVDIFFVISGFLITSIILKELGTGKFSISKFYERRARRILPALTTVILISIPFAIFLLPPEDLNSFAKSSISSLTFWSNFQFSLETGYFDTPGEYKPLLHTWSLSIEEQFYIIYPIFFILLIKFKEKFLIFTISIILLLSLFFSQWSGNFNLQYPFVDDNILFYSQSFWSEFMMPFGRIWELALGAICCFLITSKKNYLQIDNEKVKLFNFLSLVGVCLIFFSFFYLSKNFPYPSFYSLIPTLGVTLLILFCQKGTFIQKILSNKILVFTGLISYSAYLFHYPIFSFIKYFYVSANNLLYILLIPIVLFISFLSWKYIEKPFRQKNTPLKKLIIFISFMYFIIISTSFFIFSKDGLKERVKFNLPQSIVGSFNELDSGMKCFDINYIHLEKNQKNICEIGNSNNEKIDFVIFGDSHIVSFHDLFNRLAKKYNKKGLFIGYSGCPPILDIYTLRSDQVKKDCNKLNKYVFEIINDKQIKNLVLISKWTYYTDGNNFGKNLNFISSKPRRSTNKILSRKAFELGMNKTLNKYSKIGTNILIFNQVPHQLMKPEQIYYRSYDSNINKFERNLLNYSVSLEKHHILQQFVTKLFSQSLKKFKNLNLINFDDIFCEKIKSKCLVGNSKHSFYTDESHLNFYGVELTADKVEEYISNF